MVNKTVLIEGLEKLANSLESSNKVDTAKYFSDKAKQINVSASNEELKDICQELSSCGSISQYANFSHEEDVLLDLIFQNVTDILSSEVPGTQYLIIDGSVA